MIDELDDFEKETFARHNVRSDLFGEPTPMEQKWLDAVRSCGELQCRGCIIDSVLDIWYHDDCPIHGREVARWQKQRAWFEEKVKIEEEHPHISVGGLAADFGMLDPPLGWRVEVRYSQEFVDRGDVGGREIEVGKWEHYHTTHDEELAQSMCEHNNTEWERRYIPLYPRIEESSDE